MVYTLSISALLFAKMFYCVFRFDAGKDRWTGWEKLSVAAAYFAAMVGFGASPVPEMGYAVSALTALMFSREGPASAALAGVLGGTGLLTGGMPPVAAVTLPLAATGFTAPSEVRSSPRMMISPARTMSPTALTGVPATVTM